MTSLVVTGTPVSPGLEGGRVSRQRTGMDEIKRCTFYYFNSRGQDGRGFAWTSLHPLLRGPSHSGVETGSGPGEAPVLGP